MPEWLQGNPQVVLEVAEVTFIDRSGLAMRRRIISPRRQIINASALVKELLRGQEEAGNGLEAWV